MNGAGHRIVWRLCTNHVTPATRKALIQLNLDPNNDDFKTEVNADDADFISSATEPDNDKEFERMHSNGCGDHGADHFDNIPTYAADYKGPKLAVPSGDNATEKTAQSITTLLHYVQASKSGNVSAQLLNDAAQARRWLAHETGDLFGQPLHCINRFSTAFPAPKGDEGGNSILLPGLFPPSVKYQEFHAFCDGMGIDPTAPAKGNFATPFAAEASGPVTPAELSKIDAHVVLIENAYPSKHFTVQQLTMPKIDTPADITASLNQIAQANAAVANQMYTYKGAELQSGTKIASNDPWLTTTTATLHERAALGAYQMAYLLNMIFDPANAAQAAIGTGPMAPAAINLAVTALTNPSTPADTSGTASPAAGPTAPTQGHAPRPTPAAPKAPGHSGHSPVSTGTSPARHSHTTAA